MCILIVGSIPVSVSYFLTQSNKQDINDSMQHNCVSFVQKRRYVILHYSLETWSDIMDIKRWITIVNLWSTNIEKDMRVAAVEWCHINDGWYWSVQQRPQIDSNLMLCDSTSVATQVLTALRYYATGSLQKALVRHQSQGVWPVCQMQFASCRCINYCNIMGCRFHRLIWRWRRSIYLIPKTCSANPSSYATPWCEESETSQSPHNRKLYECEHIIIY